MGAGEDPERLLETLELTEYEVTALSELLSLGRTTAPNLSEATGIPKARIYGVLDSLADRGFIKVIPGRPKAYQPKAPEQILNQAEENARQDFESRRNQLDGMRERFLEVFQPRFETASEDITPTEELFHVLDVGDPSERETRELYHQADTRIRVLTKSFEYFDAVEPAFEEALERGIDIRVLFVHPRLLESANRSVQAELVHRLQDTYPAVGLRFSDERHPIRGTLADPSLDYESGKAIFLVEEEEVPLHMRQAAVTENASFVAGMGRYFDLIWEYDSLTEYPTN